MPSLNAPLIPLAPSQPKSLFIERLGLDRPQYQHIYASMRAEAAEAWQRLQDDRASLLKHLQPRLHVQPPFTHAQISENAIDHQIGVIYSEASPETKAFYDLAIPDATGRLNWIIRWLLFHMCRDRDRRRGSRRLPPNTGDTQPDAASTSAHSSTTTASPAGDAHACEPSELFNSSHDTSSTILVLGQHASMTLLDITTGVSTRTPTPDSHNEAQSVSDLNGAIVAPVLRYRLPFDPIRDL